MALKMSCGVTVEHTSILIIIKKLLKYIFKDIFIEIKLIINS